MLYDVIFRDGAIRALGLTALEAARLILGRADEFNVAFRRCVDLTCEGCCDCTGVNCCE